MKALTAAKVFFTGSHAAAYMTFAFVDVEHLADAPEQRRVDAFQPQAHVFMYRALANAEFSRSVPDRRLVLGDVPPEHNRALLNYSLQEYYLP